MAVVRAESHHRPRERPRRRQVASLLAMDLSLAFSQAGVPCPIEAELLVALAAADEVTVVRVLRQHHDRVRTGHRPDESARGLSRDVERLAVHRGARRLPSGFVGPGAS